MQMQTSEIYSMSYSNFQILQQYDDLSSQNLLRKQRIYSCFKFLIQHFEIILEIIEKWINILQIPVTK